MLNTKRGTICRREDIFEKTQNTEELKSSVTKKSGRIINKGDKPFKDEFEIDERTLTLQKKKR